MKHLLPGLAELAIFATLALLSAVIVYGTSSRDLFMSAFTVPIFIAAAVMGLRRNWRQTDAREAVAVTETVIPDLTQDA